MRERSCRETEDTRSSVACQSMERPHKRLSQTHDLSVDSFTAGAGCTERGERGQDRRWRLSSNRGGDVTSVRRHRQKTRQSTKNRSATISGRTQA